MPLLLQELFLRRPRKKPGPDGCERSHFLSVGSRASFAVDDGPFLFAVWLTSDRGSGFIFAVDELGESSLVSVTLYPFSREAVFLLSEAYITNDSYQADSHYKQQ